MVYGSTLVVDKTLKTSVDRPVLRIPVLHLAYLSGLERRRVRYILGAVRHPPQLTHLEETSFTVKSNPLGGLVLECHTVGSCA